MDNESRHELQDNDLVKSLGKAQGLWQRHGTTILVALLVLLGIYTFIQWRSQSASEREETIQTELASAFSMLQSLDGVRLDPANETLFAERRDELYTAVESHLHNVLDAAEDDDTKATVALYTGQLNWKLAQLPTPAGATTRPALGLSRTEDQLLEDAATSFEKVVNTFPHTAAANDARFGLAAIAEQRGSFDRATSIYQQILDDDSAREGHKLIATVRLRWLRDLNLRSDATPAPTSAPATQPAS